MSESREFRVYPDMVGRLKETEGGVLIADNATVLGDVRLARDVSIWFGATIRGDDAPIEIGEATNVQDNTVIHVDVDAPLKIGRGVTIGHSVVLHGVELGDYCLVGMNCSILGGAKIGAHCIIGAGALVAENAVIPEGSVVLGLPGKICRQVTEAEREAQRWRAGHYVSRARSYLADR